MADRCLYNMVWSLFNVGHWAPYWETSKRDFHLRFCTPYAFPHLDTRFSSRTCSTPQRGVEQVLEEKRVLIRCIVVKRVEVSKGKRTYRCRYSKVLGGWAPFNLHPIPKVQIKRCRAVGAVPRGYWAHTDLLTRGVLNGVEDNQPLLW